MSYGALFYFDMVYFYFDLPFCVYIPYSYILYVIAC